MRETSAFPPPPPFVLICFLRYTNSNIPPHTDCTYFEEAPGLQIFHCISGSYSGGLTSLIDGFAVASRMSAQHADAYAVLCNVRIPFRYIGDGYHLSNRCHVFTLDDAGHVVQFRYNNCDRAPLDAATLALHPQSGAPPFAGCVTYEHVYDALQKLHRVMDDPSMKVQFKLAPGKVPLPCAFHLACPCLTAAPPRQSSSTTGASFTRAPSSLAAAAFAERTCNRRSGWAA